MTSGLGCVIFFYVTILTILIHQSYLRSGYFLVDRKTINPNIDFHELNHVAIKVQVLEGIFRLTAHFESMCKAWNSVKDNMEPFCQMPSTCGVYQNLKILTESLFDPTLEKAFFEIQLNFHKHFNHGKNCYHLSKILHEQTEAPVVKYNQFFTKLSTFNFIAFYT